MAGLRVHVVMPESLVARIDAACPTGVSRGEFVRRAVEQALDGGPAGAASGARVSPAPAEPPAVEQALSAKPNGAEPSTERVPGTLPQARSAASAEPPGARSPVLPPSLSSAMAKRDVRPVPKGKP